MVHKKYRMQSAIWLGGAVPRSSDRAWKHNLIAGALNKIQGRAAKERWWGAKKHKTHIMQSMVWLVGLVPRANIQVAKHNLTNTKKNHWMFVNLRDKVINKTIQYFTPLKWEIWANCIGITVTVIIKKFKAIGLINPNMVLLYSLVKSTRLAFTKILCALLHKRLVDYT